MSAEHISCEEVIEQLFHYLDREVDEALGERIHEHLARCRDCFSRAEFERRLRNRVRNAAEAKAPVRLRRRLKRIMESY